MKEPPMTTICPSRMPSYSWYSWLALCIVPLVWLALLGIDRINVLMGAHSLPATVQKKKDGPPPHPPEVPWRLREVASPESLTERNVQAAHTMSLRFPARSHDLLRVLQASESFVVTTSRGLPTSYLTAEGDELRSHPWPQQRQKPIAARIDIHGYTGAIPEAIAYLLDHTPEPQQQTLDIVFGEPLLLRLIAAAADASAPNILAVVPTNDPPGFGLIGAD